MAKTRFIGAWGSAFTHRVEPGRGLPRCVKTELGIIGYLRVFCRSSMLSKRNWTDTSTLIDKHARFVSNY